MPSSTDAINKVLLHEGGYVNNPKDAGKRTNLGITQKVYETFLGRKLIGPDTDAPKGQPMSEAESVMRNLPKGNAIAIYKKNYWDMVQGDKIKSYAVAYALFDQAVNRGHNKVVSQAQAILGVPVDGVAGPIFVAAINKMPEKTFLDKFLAASKQSYIDIVKNNPSQSVFLNGWMKRLDSVTDYVSKNKAVVAATGIGFVAVLLLAGYLLTRKPSTSSSTSKSKAIYG